MAAVDAPSREALLGRALWSTLGPMCGIKCTGACIPSNKVHSSLWPPNKSLWSSRVRKAENLGFDLHILLCSWTMCSPLSFVPRRVQSFGSYNLCTGTLYSFLFACLVPRRARSTVIYFWFSAAVLSRKPLCNMKILFSKLSMGELRKVSSPHVVWKNDWTITVLYFTLCDVVAVCNLRIFHANAILAF